MASNSLLECVVYAWAAAKSIMQEIDGADMPGELPNWMKVRYVTQMKR
ncbi:L-aspartate oxidase [Vibrio ishigakensis]|nr:L-aspartate oxidase [Vibrio ishigakensis]